MSIKTVLVKGFCLLLVALPFLKSPEQNEMFSAFFSKSWQDALQLSLFNYLSVIFQSMPMPSLMELQKPSQKVSLHLISYLI